MARFGEVASCIHQGHWSLFGLVGPACAGVHLFYDTHGDGMHSKAGAVGGIRGVWSVKKA